METEYIPQTKEDLSKIVPSTFPQTLKALQQSAEWPQFVGQPAADAGIFPVGRTIFAALFSVKSADAVRAIVLGQDPYPRRDSAVGVAFNDGRVRRWAQPMSPSLRHVVKMSLAEIGAIDAVAPVGVLREALIGREEPAEWFARTADQGVLWLNTSLTFAGKDNLVIHKRFWGPIVRAIITDIAVARGAGAGLVFVLWGAHAQKLGRSLVEIVRRHGGSPESACAPHPAVFKFTSSIPFEKIRAAFEAAGLDSIEFAPQILPKQQ